MTCESQSKSPTALALEHRESAKKSIFVINPTGRCNLRCIHCWNARYIGNELDPRDVRKVIDRIPGHVRIHFLGGEPLLHPNILELIAHSSKRGHYTSLVTNGLLVRRVGVDHLLRSGLSEIGVSIDGPDEVTNDEIRGRGSFRRAWEALVQISDHLVSGPTDVKLLLSVTAMHKNARQIPALIERVAERRLHIDKVSVDRVVLEGRAREDPRLAVPPEMWLDTCEQVCGKWRQYRTLHHLTLKVPPLVHHYLTSKYGIFLRDSIIGCPGLESPLGGCLTSDGRIYSCSREFLIRAAQKQGYLPLQGEKYRDLVRLTGGILRLPDFITTLEPFLKPPDGELCRGCEWKWGCRVKCPIRSLLKQKYSAELCQESSRRMTETRGPENRTRSGSHNVRPRAEKPESSFFSFRHDVYLKQHRDASTSYFSVSLDKMVTFPPEIHAEYLFDRSCRPIPLSKLRREYTCVYKKPAHYLELVIQKLAYERFVYLRSSAGAVLDKSDTGKQTVCVTGPQSGHGGLSVTAGGTHEGR